MPGAHLSPARRLSLFPPVPGTPKNYFGEWVGGGAFMKSLLSDFLELAALATNWAFLIVGIFSVCLAALFARAQMATGLIIEVCDGVHANGAFGIRAWAWLINIAAPTPDAFKMLTGFGAGVVGATRGTDYHLETGQALWTAGDHFIG